MEISNCIHIVNVKVCKLEKRFKIEQNEGTTDTEKYWKMIKLVEESHKIKNTWPVQEK